MTKDYFYIGNNKITELYSGSTPIKQIYKGSVLVWEKGNPPVNIKIFMGFLLDDTQNYKRVYSSDGSNWIESTIPILANAGNPVKKVAYGNGKFVVIGKSQTAISEDGINWTVGGDLPSAGSSWYESVVYGNGKFVIIMHNGNSYYSEDGITWTKSATSPGANIVSVTFGNNTFIASDFSYSVDGITWTKNSNMTVNGGCMDYLNGYFINRTLFASSMTLYYSHDGISWNSVSMGSPEGTTYMTYSNGKYYLLDAEGNLNITEDLSTWTTKKAIADFGYSLTSDETGLYIISYEGKIKKSIDDGSTWTELKALTVGEDPIWTLDYL